jgi:hypothetical protein
LPLYDRKNSELEAHAGRELSSRRAEETGLIFVSEVGDEIFVSKIEGLEEDLNFSADVVADRQIDLTPCGLYLIVRRITEE